MIVFHYIILHSIISIEVSILWLNWTATCGLLTGLHILVQSESNAPRLPVIPYIPWKEVCRVRTTYLCAWKSGIALSFLEPSSRHKAATAFSCHCFIFFKNLSYKQQLSHSGSWAKAPSLFPFFIRGLFF